MSNPSGSSPFIDSVRRVIRLRHMSLATEKAHIHWVRGFIFDHSHRGSPAVESTGNKSNTSTNQECRRKTEYPRVIQDRLSIGGIRKVAGPLARRAAAAGAVPVHLPGCVRGQFRVAR